MKKEYLNNSAVSELCMELSLLLHAGIGLGGGLRLLAEEGGESQARLSALAEQVERGEPLHAAMRTAACFPPDVVGMVQVGERAGRTEEALRALADYYENRERLDRQVRSALLYPAGLLVILLIVIVVLLAKVLPVFNEVYASLGGQLSGVAGGLLAVGRWLNVGMPVLLVLLAAAVALLGAFAASGRFRETLLSGWRRRRDGRGLGGRVAAARFAQALAMGLRSGLPVEEAMELAGGMQAESGLGRRCRECVSQLNQGAGLAEALRQADLFPAAYCRMLALGVRGGSGDAVMEDIARRMFEDSENAIADAVARVEPTLVIVSSLLVGMILLSVMLPLMNIMAAIG